MVERGVGERQSLGGCLHELDPRAEPLRALASISGLWSTPVTLEAARDELGGDEPRPRRDVEDVAAVARQPVSEEAPPARVLAEREQPRRRGRTTGRAARRALWRRPWHAAYCGDVSLEDELERVAEHARLLRRAVPRVSGVLAAEADPGHRVYLCSIDGADGTRAWVAVRSDGSVVTGRPELRAAVSIAALCEVAADTAGGGDLEGLVASLADLREREAPDGIEDAEDAARQLLDVLGVPPQLSTPARLDEIGAATRRLEQELDPGGASPFAAALKSAQSAVSELQREVEAGYLVDLES